MTSRNRVMRILKYKNALKRMKAFGFIKVFSNNLGDSIGITSVQVRKDFSLFSITGNKKGGYVIDDLLVQINTILGKEEVQNIVVVGCGKLGRSLMNYKGFENESISIVAGFDVLENKIDRDSTIPILPISEISTFIREKNIEIAILSTPDSEAQKMLDIIIEAGIKGVLNFVPVRLNDNNLSVIHNVDLSAELEALLYFTRTMTK